MYIKSCLVALTFITIISCDPIPGLTKICKITDSECIVESANAFVRIFAAGITQYGVNTLDPHPVKKMDLYTPNLNLAVSDLTVVGLKDSELKYVKVNKEKSTAQIKLVVNLKIDGQYDMKGKLLFLALEGKGPLHVIIRNMELVINVDFKEVMGKDNKIHWELKHHDYTYSLKDKSDVKFENLFNGNEALAGASKEVIAASGNEIIEEAGGPLITDIVTSVVTEINNFFGANAISDLILD